MIKEVVLNCGFVLVFNNRFIIQWGLLLIMDTTYIDLIFPIAFTSTSYKVICMDKNQAVTTTNSFSPIFTEANSYATRTKTRIICTLNDAQAVNWVAIGY